MFLIKSCMAHVVTEMLNHSKMNFLILHCIVAFFFVVFSKMKNCMNLLRLELVSSGKLLGHLIEAYHENRGMVS